MYRRLNTPPDSGSSRTCRTCGATKILDEFYVVNRTKGYRSGSCRTCWRGRDAKREKTDAYRLARKASSLRRKYGLSLDDLVALIDAQGGRCAVCLSDLTSSKMDVDHDHACCSGPTTCGECVRGVLCARCNMALGLLGDDASVMTRAAEYVTQTREQKQ